MKKRYHAKGIGIYERKGEASFLIGRADGFASDGEKKAQEIANALNAIEEGQDGYVEVARLDTAYEERNRVVALLARLYPSGILKTSIEGWDPAWHNCVYLDTPLGQMSWHYHDRDAWMFEGLEPYDGTWDGHSTEEKYNRMRQLVDDIDRMKREAWPAPGEELIMELPLGYSLQEFKQELIAAGAVCSTCKETPHGTTCQLPYCPHRELDPPQGPLPEEYKQWLAGTDDQQS